jgi:lysophospholipase L1-like esterase
MNILFMGDSLVEYFDWQSRFPEHRIANHGVAGESVQGLHSRAGRIRDACPEADLIFIMSGINNVAMEDLDFFESYRLIINELHSFYPDARIFINSLLPTVVSFIPDDTIGWANSHLHKLAADSGVEYLNIYSRFVDTKGNPIREYLLEDGVHLSSHGYTVWSGAVEEVIFG